MSAQEQRALGQYLLELKDYFCYKLRIKNRELGTAVNLAAPDSEAGGLQLRLENIPMSISLQNTDV